MQSMESRLDSKIQRLDSRVQSVESSIKELEYKLTIKLGAMLVVSIGVFASLVRFFPAAGH